MKALRDLLAVTLACDPAPPAPEVKELAQAFARLDRTESEDRRELAAVRERAQELRARADAVAAIWRSSEQDFKEAVRSYDAATTAGEHASVAFANAIRDFQRAERRYRQIALLVIAVAASAQLCAATVSTRSFRAQLHAEGVDLRGMDIDHIWPRSLGGVDHPLNYQVLDAHLNRSLGADVTAKIMAQPLAVLQGLVVSALASLSC